MFDLLLVGQPQDFDHVGIVVFEGFSFDPSVGFG
jgi:hypothetical protein